MKKTRMPQRLLALVLVLMMLISVLPVSAMAAELTPADAQTGLTATDVTNELTDSDRLSIFEENMDPSKVSKSDVPADDEMVRVVVQLDADSLLDARNRTNAGMSMLDFQQTAAAKAQLGDRRCPALRYERHGEPEHPQLLYLQLYLRHQRLCRPGALWQDQRHQEA